MASLTVISPETAVAREITEDDIDDKFAELTALNQTLDHPGKEERKLALQAELHQLEHQKAEQDNAREAEIDRNMSCGRRVTNRVMCISEGVVFVACFGWLVYMCKKG